MRSFFLSLLLSVFWLALPFGAGAAPTSSPAPGGNAGQAAAAIPEGLTAGQVQQLLAVLQDPGQRARLVATLQTLQKVLPAAQPAAAQAATPAAPAASGTPTQTAPVAPPEVALKPNSLGADLISQADWLLNGAATAIISTVTAITAYNEIGAWLEQAGRDPALRSALWGVGWRLVIVLCIAWLAEYTAWRFAGPLYRRLGRASGAAGAESGDEMRGAPVSPDPAPGLRQGAQRRSGWALLRDLPNILLAAVVDAVPPLAFLAAALVMLATPVAPDRLFRLMIGSVVLAYVLSRFLLVAARAGFCAPYPRLRMLHISDEDAAFLAIWCRRIAGVFVLGYSVVRIGGLLGMSAELQHSLARLFGLAVHLMLAVMVLRRRREVAAWIRGQQGEHPSGWRKARARLASVWHWQAIIAIMLVWIVYATRLTDGVAHPMRLILFTLGLILLFRVLHIVILGLIDRAFTLGDGFTGTRYTMIVTRAALYHRPLRIIVDVLTTIVFFVILLEIWGLNVFAWLYAGMLGRRLLGSLGTIAVALVLAVMVWEAMNLVMQVYVDRLSRQGAYVRAARLRTILPLLRNVLLIALLAIFALIVLSIIGVNIGPLLAGAGIIGVAVGFGSQKLVQDFINGIFLLLENAMQVGDWVTAGGLSGSVEALSIRTLRLRAGDGSVHIIPFSAVTTVTNTNRGKGNAAVSVTISYDEDTDRAAELLKRIVLDLRKEDGFKDGMLSDFQYWGVDNIDGTTATLVGQVVCTDTARWGVQRELNRRIKLAFQEKGIRIIPPVKMLSLQHPLDVRVEKPGPEGKAEGGA